MDSVDLAFRLEKRFGIEFQMDEAIYLFQSPRQVIRLVTSRLSGETLPIPDTTAMMHRIDAALKSLPDYRRRWFRNTIDSMFPARNREQNWLAFGKSLGVDLPPLESHGSQTLRIPPECGNHLRLMFWMIEQHPDRVLWKFDSIRVDVPENASEWDGDSIQAAVFEIIIDVLGLDPDEITLDADMVEALGME